MIGDIGINIKGAAVNGGWANAAAEVSDAVTILSHACSISIGTKSRGLHPGQRQPHSFRSCRASHCKQGNLAVQSSSCHLHRHLDP